MITLPESEHLILSLCVLVLEPDLDLPLLLLLLLNFFENSQPISTLVQFVVVPKISSIPPSEIPSAEVCPNQGLPLYSHLLNPSLLFDLFVLLYTSIRITVYSLTFLFPGRS